MPFYSEKRKKSQDSLLLKDNVLFVHIPKTGGSFFENCCRKAYRNQLAYGFKWSFEGSLQHQPLKILLQNYRKLEIKSVSPENVSCVSIVRNPYKRAFSQLFHQLNKTIYKIYNISRKESTVPLLELFEHSKRVKLNLTKLVDVSFLDIIKNRELMDCYVAFLFSLNRNNVPIEYAKKLLFDAYLYFYSKTLKKPEHFSDRHFLPQYKFLTLDEETIPDYIMLCKTEKLTDQVKEMGFIRLPAPTRGNRNIFSLPKHKDVRDFLDVNFIDFLNHIYKKDFELFNYEQY